VKMMIFEVGVMAHGEIYCCSVNLRSFVNVNLVLNFCLDLMDLG
jgi:hypothetical protein